MYPRVRSVSASRPTQRPGLARVRTNLATGEVQAPVLRWGGVSVHRIACTLKNGTLNLSAAGRIPKRLGVVQEGTRKPNLDV